MKIKVKVSNKEIKEWIKDIIDNRGLERLTLREQFQLQEGKWDFNMFSSIVEVLVYRDIMKNKSANKLDIAFRNSWINYKRVHKLFNEVIGEQ